jgi:hypothetical protein
VCDRLDAAIAEAVGFRWPLGRQEQSIIEAADRRALFSEAAVLLPEPIQGADLGLEIPPLDDPLQPAEAEKLFLEVHGSALTRRV